MDETVIQFWIQVTNFVKDLGVFIHNSFLPSIHSTEVAFKARRMLFMTRRSFAELSVSVFALLYNTLVRPHLEYAMQACLPNLVVNPDCLDEIQRLARRLVKGFHQLSYEERLHRLEIHSLHRGRLGDDLKAVYNAFLED